jgi:hypothetical protein
MKSAWSEKSQSIRNQIAECGLSDLGSAATRHVNFPS